MTKSIIRVAPGAIDITGIALEYVSNSDDTETFSVFYSSFVRNVKF